MAVTVAGTVESLRTDTSDPMTWSHNAGTASPQGVVVSLIHGTSSTDHVVSVTYGTRSLTEIVRATDTATEAGAAELWFAGGSIPTGTQTVTVDLASGTTDDILGTSITLDAAFDLVKLSSGQVDNNTANPSVALTNAPGNSAMAFAAFYSGLSTLADIAPGTDCTEVSTNELAGNFTGSLYRQTTASTGAFTIAATSANDDCAFAAANFGESVVTATSGSYTLTGTAVTFVHGYTLAAASGSYTLTGTVASLERNTFITMASGSYLFAGVETSLRGNHLFADSGSYTIVGATSILAFAVNAISGTYVLTGTAATLVKTGVGETLVVDSGSYVLTGSDTTLTQAGGVTDHLLTCMGLGR